MYEYFYNLIGLFIKNLFILLGPIYIKIGQLLSYDYPILKNLQTLQNKCPDLNSNEIIYFQTKYPHLSISSKSIAAGSVSVVHTGLLDNKIVAIKIKRPNIDIKIKRSLWLIYIFKELVTIIPYYKFINIKKKIEYAVNLYQTHTDFRQELLNWKLFKANNENAVDIIIPNFYENYCDDDILVQEYLPGYNIVQDKFNTKSQNIKMGNLIIGCYFSGILNGFVHGDLHPGNLAWKDNTVIIYDFGLMMVLDKTKKNMILDVLNSVFEKDSRALLEHFLKYFIDMKYVPSQEAKIKLINKFDGEFYHNGGNLFWDIKNFLENNELVFNNNMFELELSLLSLLTTLANLYYSLDDGLEDFIESFNESIL